MDVVIVSNAYDQRTKALTSQAVYTVQKSDTYVHRVFVIEQQKNVKHENATMTLHYDFEFNYNRCLNLGIEHCVDNRIALCNNDLIFRSHWARKIVKAMQDNECGSASPYCKGVHDPIHKVRIHDKIGYAVRELICGWCIVLDRDTRERIGKLDEGVSFWFSDNLYAEQIKAHKIKHVLCFDSRVDHLESKTLFASKRIDEYTKGQIESYRIAKRKIRNS